MTDLRISVGDFLKALKPVPGGQQTVQDASGVAAQVVAELLHVGHQAPQREHAEPGSEQVLVHMQQVLLFFHKLKQLPPAHGKTNGAKAGSEISNSDQVK